MAQPKEGREAAQHEDSVLVAVIGSGIVGVSMAIGLTARGVRVALYERASNFHEIGAGIAFTGVARQCMAQLSPDILESFMRVSSENQHAYDNYWDGYHHTDEDTFSDEDGLLFRFPNSNMAWRSCLRSNFLNELSRALPPGIINFGKELVSYEDRGIGDSVTLRFTDGSTTVCDILIGCDGLNSCVRRQMFLGSQAREPRYTKKTSYRFLVPIKEARSALGKSKAHNHCMHTGPGAHILSYPVAQQTLTNVVFFLSDDDREPCASDRESILKHFVSWRPEVRALLTHMPEAPMMWRIYDTADYPAPFYSRGSVTIAGDAAHASAPHHGAGAGFGMEDALSLATVVALAAGENRDRRHYALVTAIEAYNEVRYSRTQWLVRSSRETGDIYEWMYPSSGNDPLKIEAELTARQQNIWHFDVGEMVESSRNAYCKRLEIRYDPLKAGSPQET
ncbi:FAD/NAD(P)-binding domain-containing protein [Xylaria longipes]|nr:FAD/NAD(P)-binding domain-containing protein [Xylaria longipes]